MINFSKQQIKQINTIWKNYISNNKEVYDTKGEKIPDIDKSREKAIIDLDQIISDFNDNQLNIYEFKTSIDSYNKRNNLWGFTATKGQMFFNQLVKTHESNIKELTKLLKEVIAEPANLEDALSKIKKLETFVLKQYSKAKNKRKVAKPSSVSYFLSYFWQIHNHTKWPIAYTSLINTFKELELLIENNNQAETYKNLFNINEEIKKLLTNNFNLNITNWDAEHAFWEFSGNPNLIKKSTTQNEPEQEKEKEIPKLEFKASFDIGDYLMPKISNLVEVGQQANVSNSKKGSQFEKLVAEVFNFLDFEVDFLGQGKGRNPDAIIKFREENTAFLIDAKAYTKGYSLGLDDRAIKEYIHFHCPRLLKEGYKKIGFIIVSNSFTDNMEGFINEITWNTEIRRFILLTSEALLYLLAYKIKDKLSLNMIVEGLVSFGNPIEVKDIIQGFDDV